MNHMRKGWRRDSLDHRDRKLKLTRDPTTLPPAVDLRHTFAAPHDQGDCNACVGNAIADIDAFVFKRHQPPSRLMIYYNARRLEGDPQSDNGCEIRNGIKGISKWGACDEVVWPYKINELRAKPLQMAYTQAAQVGNYAKLYFRLNHDIDQFRAVLADDSPFVFGFSVFESFESDQVASTGIMPLPGRNEAIVGGHAVIGVGYDHADKVIIVRNSWGTGWGQRGYFLMPYDFITDSDYCDDFWVIKSVGPGAP